ncbi:MAG: hypothetical protein F6K24_14880 [Okeania sp. SIO2D1]|nr:hypothetical protein [Okeania sp. SIO2D1]
MKQVLQPNQENQPSLIPQIIKTFLPVVGLCLVLGGGGLVAVFSQKPKTEKLTPNVEVNTEIIQPKLPPYTLFVEGEKVRVKFHSNDSDIEFSNLSDKQKVCLANGGGIGCVLPGYQPLLEVEEKTTTSSGIKRQTFKVSDIEVSQKMIDNIMVGGGVVLGLLLINRFRK